MKRFVNFLLGLNNLRKFCGNAAVFGRFRERYRLKILDRPKKGGVLVLAPHPDDDVFGCGGTLVLHAKQGDQVKIVYFAGNVAKKFPISNFQFPIKEGGTINRKKEAEEAAKILKIADIEFWGLGDNKFSADRKNVARLKKVIEEYQPKIIYCPSFSDTNPDHFEVAKMLKQVMRDEKCEMRENSAILLYEVWTPIFINRLLKIDSVIKQKKVAMACHKSQLSDRSYFNAIIGLNQYRAGMFNVGKYAEGFWEMDGKLYIKLFNKFSLD